MARFMREKILRNRWVSGLIAHEKIVLDNPLADTYHTVVFCQGLPAYARKVCRGSRVNRGADLYDE